MRILLMLFCGAILTGCSVSKSSYSPSKKYSPEQLQRDYKIYQTTLEEAHPGLYWYTSRDSMNAYFDWGRQRLNDSLTEPEFRRVLTYVTAQIRCGHTAVRSSKAFVNYFDTLRISRVFPLSFKLWSADGSFDTDTTVVLANLNRRDSVLKRGTVVTAINGLPIEKIIDTMSRYIASDGYNRTHKYQVLSNRGYFGSLYVSLFGYSPVYAIDYIDSLGNQNRTLVGSYRPLIDTAARAARPPMQVPPKPNRRERKNMRRNAVRMLKIDTVDRVAVMELHSFSRGYGLRPFFRRSFKAIKKHDIQHLVVDVRNNTGGSPNNSTMITRYLGDKRFKVGDSLYAITKKKTYGRYMQDDFFNRLFMTFFTKKRKDGYYHLGYFERHWFKPRKKNHYDGQSYILIGGSSFSATTLFASALINQDNVWVIGEETGGGAYGNTAWQIPTLTLPETGVRVNVPLYRLVIDTAYPKTGRGVMPEIAVKPTVQSVRDRTDPVMQKIAEIINAGKKKEE